MMSPDAPITTVQYGNLQLQQSNESHDDLSLFISDNDDQRNANVVDNFVAANDNFVAATYIKK